MPICVVTFNSWNIPPSVFDGRAIFAKAVNPTERSFFNKTNPIAFYREFSGHRLSPPLFFVSLNNLLLGNQSISLDADDLKDFSGHAMFVAVQDVIFWPLFKDKKNFFHCICYRPRFPFILTRYLLCLMATWQQEKALGFTCLRLYLWKLLPSCGFVLSCPAFLLLLASHGFVSDYTYVALSRSRLADCH